MSIYFTGGHGRDEVDETKLIFPPKLRIDHRCLRVVCPFRCLRGLKAYVVVISLSYRPTRGLDDPLSDEVGQSSLLYEASEGDPSFFLVHVCLPDFLLF